MPSEYIVDAGNNQRGNHKSPAFRFGRLGDFFQDNSQEYEEVSGPHYDLRDDDGKGPLTITEIFHSRFHNVTIALRSLNGEQARLSLSGDRDNQKEVIEDIVSATGYKLRSARSRQ